MLFVTIYVDDFLIIINSSKLKKRLEKFLRSRRFQTFTLSFRLRSNRKWVGRGYLRKYQVGDGFNKPLVQAGNVNQKRFLGIKNQGRVFAIKQSMICVATEVCQIKINIIVNQLFHDANLVFLALVVGESRLRQIDQMSFRNQSEIGTP